MRKRKVNTLSGWGLIEPTNTDKRKRIYHKKVKK